MAKRKIARPISDSRKRGRKTKPGKAADGGAAATANDDGASDASNAASEASEASSGEEDEEKGEKKDALSAGLFALGQRAVRLPGKGKDSALQAEELFAWLIHPVTLEEFYSEYWGKKPLVVRRKDDREYYDSVFSKDDMDEAMRTRTLKFGFNVDVTKFRDGKRKTFSSEGDAVDAQDVWRQFEKEKRTVRMLHPQLYSDKVWKMVAMLEEFFGCVVGTNAYLTPKGAQGFAPHFDDVDVFIVQTEGTKHWRLYKPPAGYELARNSSRDFTVEEVGEPTHEIELKQGDLLYFPRGVVHQAWTPKDTHSLHLTVSTGQRATWTEYLHKLLPLALEEAFAADVAFREMPPRGFMNQFGILHQDQDSVHRRAFSAHTRALLHKLVDHLPLDQAVDELAVELIRDATPPKWSKSELPNLARAVARGEQPAGAAADAGAAGEAEAAADEERITPDTAIVLSRRNIARLVTDAESDGLVLYHIARNIRNRDPGLKAKARAAGSPFGDEEARGVEFEYEDGPLIEAVLRAYPAPIKVGALPHERSEMKEEIARILFAEGIVRIAKM